MAHKQVSERIRTESFFEDVAKSHVQAVIKTYAHKINYSDKYCDDQFEYRHVILPQELAKVIPKHYLMSEREWRTIGVQQSIGWEHYMVHRPEPHVMLFRRAKGYQPTPAAIEAAQKIVAGLTHSVHHQQA